MHAVVIVRPGGPEVLQLRDVPLPEPGSRQIRVRVHATAVNRADLLQRRGLYPAPPGAPADVPGLEFAGVVDALGPDASRYRPGERVMGIVGGGAYAQALVTHEDEALPIPRTLSFEQAAAIPEAFITAHDALFTRASLRATETVLIHAVGSGVGVAGLQLARSAGAHVIGTSRSGWKLERARGLGLDAGIELAGGDFAQAVARETAGRGADVILDLVGGAYVAEDVAAAALRARIVVVGLVAGRDTRLDLGMLLRKRLTLAGTVLRSRSLEEKISATAAFARDALPWLEAGDVRPVIDHVFPLADAAAAHAYVEANENFGKVVLRVAEGGPSQAARE